MEKPNRDAVSPAADTGPSFSRTETVAHGSRQGNREPRVARRPARARRHSGPGTG